MRPLLSFRGFAHDPQGVLTAVHRLTLVGIKLRLNISILELGIAALTHADGRRSLFDDPQFALGHIQSLAHREGQDLDLCKSNGTTTHHRSGSETTFPPLIF